MLDLSVVFGTYNRKIDLVACLVSVRRAVGRLSYEMVITDGGSTDGSLEFLRAQPDVRLIEHGKPLGPVKAYNDAFAIAQGEHVAYINDDLILEPACLAEAVCILQDKSNVGVVSLPYVSSDNPGALVSTVTVRPDRERQPNGFTMASFGVLRKSQGDAAGWFGPWFYHYQGDGHICLALHEMGLAVRALPQKAAFHLRRNNAVRGFAWWLDGAKARSQHDGYLLRLLWGGYERPGKVCKGIDPSLLSDLESKYSTVVTLERLEGEPAPDVAYIVNHPPAIPLPEHDLLPRHGWQIYSIVPKEASPNG